MILRCLVLHLALWSLSVLAPTPLRAASEGSHVSIQKVWIDLARRGWNYQLRIPPRGRDMTIPVVISPRALAGSALCIVGERPHSATDTVLDAFRDLVNHTFGKPIPMRYAGPDARGCGSGRVVLLRLYSGFPPNRALSRDLDWLNQTYELGLPRGRDYTTISPAMAQTFFGRRGQVTHIMVKQPRGARLDELEAAFYRSILIEELFQSFTFGMDILIANRSTPFQSKLQEIPVNLSRLPWESRHFMRSLLGVTPTALCAFDVFMLHAVAQTSAAQTIEPGFVREVETNFAELEDLARATIGDPRFAALIDPSCREVPSD